MKKLLTIVTLVAFTGTSLLAGTPSAWSANAPERDWKIPVTIPSDLGRVEEMWLPEGSQERLVVYIQDAHTHPEAQENIRKILHHLEKSHGMKLFTVEAAKGLLSAEILDISSRPEINVQAAEDLMKRGMLNAIELFALDHYYAKGGGTIAGIDNPELYQDNLKVFRSVQELRALYEADLKALTEELALIKSRVYNTDLLKLDQHLGTYEAQDRDLIRHVRFLATLAEKHFGIRLNSSDEDLRFPHLLRLLRLDEIEAELKRKQETVSVETEKVLHEFAILGNKEAAQPLIGYIGQGTLHRQSITREELESGSAYLESVRYALEDLLALADGKIDFSAYPMFRNWAIYHVAQDEIVSDALFKEIDLLREALLSVLAKTPEEQTAVQLDRYVKLLGKLLALEVNREEMEYTRKRKAELMPSNIAAHLADLAEKIGVGAPHRPDNFAEKMAAFDDHLALAERFYSVAEKRDEAFVQNLLALMREGGQSRAALVSGGFHAEGLKAELQRAGLPYMVVMPRITTEAPKDLYLKRMTDQLDFMLPKMVKAIEVPVSATSPEHVIVTRKPEYLNEDLLAVTGRVFAQGLGVQEARRLEGWAARELGIPVKIDPANRVLSYSLRGPQGPVVAQVGVTVGESTASLLDIVSVREVPPAAERNAIARAPTGPGTGVGLEPPGPFGPATISAEDVIIPDETTAREGELAAQILRDEITTSPKVPAQPPAESVFVASLVNPIVAVPPSGDDEEPELLPVDAVTVAVTGVDVDADLRVPVGPVGAEPPDAEGLRPTVPSAPDAKEPEGPTTSILATVPSDVVPGTAGASRAASPADARGRALGLPGPVVPEPRVPSFGTTGLQDVLGSGTTAGAPADVPEPFSQPAELAAVRSAAPRTQPGLTSLQRSGLNRLFAVVIADVATIESLRQERTGVSSNLDDLRASFAQVLGDLIVQTQELGPLLVSFRTEKAVADVLDKSGFLSSEDVKTLSDAVINLREGEFNRRPKGAAGLVEALGPALRNVINVVQDAEIGTFQAALERFAGETDLVGTVGAIVEQTREPRRDGREIVDKITTGFAGPVIDRQVAAAREEQEQAGDLVGAGATTSITSGAKAEEAATRFTATRVEGLTPQIAQGLADLANVVAELIATDIAREFTVDFFGVDAEEVVKDQDGIARAVRGIDFGRKVELWAGIIASPGISEADRAVVLRGRELPDDLIGRLRDERFRSDVVEALSGHLRSVPVEAFADRIIEGILDRHPGFKFGNGDADIPLTPFVTGFNAEVALGALSGTDESAGRAEPPQGPEARRVDAVPAVPAAEPIGRIPGPPPQGRRADAGPVLNQGELTTTFGLPNLGDQDKLTGGLAEKPPRFTPARPVTLDTGNFLPPNLFTVAPRVAVGVAVPTLVGVAAPVAYGFPSFIDQRLQVVLAAIQITDSVTSLVPAVNRVDLMRYYRSELGVDLTEQGLGDQVYQDYVALERALQALAKSNDIAAKLTEPVTPGAPAFASYYYGSQLPTNRVLPLLVQLLVNNPAARIALVVDDSEVTPEEVDLVVGAVNIATVRALGATPAPDNRFSIEIVPAAEIQSALEKTATYNPKADDRMGLTPRNEKTTVLAGDEPVVSGVVRETGRVGFVEPDAGFLAESLGYDPDRLRINASKIAALAQALAWIASPLGPPSFATPGQASNVYNMVAQAILDLGDVMAQAIEKSA